MKKDFKSILKIIEKCAEIDRTYQTKEINELFKILPTIVPVDSLNIDYKKKNNDEFKLEIIFDKNWLKNNSNFFSSDYFKRWANILKMTDDEIKDNQKNSYFKINIKTIVNNKNNFNDLDFEILREIEKFTEKSTDGNLKIVQMLESLVGIYEKQNNSINKLINKIDEQNKKIKIIESYLCYENKRNN